MRNYDNEERNIYKMILAKIAIPFLWFDKVAFIHVRKFVMKYVNKLWEFKIARIILKAIYYGLLIWVFYIILFIIAIPFIIILPRKFGTKYHKDFMKVYNVIKVPIKRVLRLIFIVPIILIARYYIYYYEYLIEVMTEPILKPLKKPPYFLWDIIILRYMLLILYYLIFKWIVILIRIPWILVKPFIEPYNFLLEYKVFRFIHKVLFYSIFKWLILTFKLPLIIAKIIVGEFWDEATFVEKRAITGYLFASPWILGFLALVVYPFGKVIYMSFNIVNQYQLDFTYKWVGFDNFHRVLFVDIDFVIELQNFIVRVLLYSPVIIALSIIIAMLLNQDIRGKGIFRMIFFLPIIILNGALLENMSDYGGMDIQLSFFVIDVLDTVIPTFALGLFVDLFELLIEILWYCGVPILIFLAMLQKVDKSLYEAASIDGANSWSIFWKIVLPAIYPAISVSIIFIVVFLANFDGNPLNNMIFVARNEPSQKEGYASAMALVYASVQMVIIAILFMLTRDKSNKKARV